MVRKGNAVIALAIWLLTVSACVVACAAARLQTSEQTVHPQGCRCCTFEWQPLIRCIRVCCGDDCC
ncbi:unnamed protein product [Coffea canephora]|uniref:Uncharacterized protein n=1 Tax=Coffea canephora TaxID=49390 RepID=A0A068UAA4_COFCA|nr:unnamed protein product [Coffea canephora]